MQCEKCQQRKATVHLTLVGPTAEVSKQHFCESCYHIVQEEHAKMPKASTELRSTPPPPPRRETVSVRWSKTGGGKARKPKAADERSTQCKRCNNAVPDREWDKNLKVCPRCHYHFRIGGRERIRSLVEAGSFQELDADMTSADPLKFAGPAAYESGLGNYQQATGLKEAVITGIGKLGHHRVGLAVLDFNFLGGSMGSVVGEKLTRLIEHCTEKALPVIIVSASGGARIYEGVFSLLQMAKTSGALAHHAGAGLPYISVLTDPTMAGVLASFAGAGGLILAEPGAKIGYAGTHVIRETTGAGLPPGFQTAEFLHDRGLIDAIISRREMKKRLVEYLDCMTGGPKKAAATG